MWLVVGLGNPGAKYERNRHNVGFRVVDELARRHGLSFKGSKLGGDVATGVITTPRGRERAALLKPMEFMNLSGYAVQRAAQFHTVALDELVVVHDELDLELGTARIKVGGGHGGHNGLRSIMEQLGKGDFIRVRVGIGRPGASRGDDNAVSGYVLSDFPSAIAGQVDDLINRSADAAEAVLGLGAKQAMNHFNRSAKLADGPREARPARGATAATPPEELDVRPRNVPGKGEEAPRSPQVGGLQTRED